MTFRPWPCLSYCVIKANLKVAATLIASLLIVDIAHAQTVQGRLLNESSGQPVTAGFVVLVGQDSTELQRTLVDEGGRFSFGASRPGRYALRSQVIGLRSTTSEFFQLDAGQVFEFDFSVPALPIELDALVVQDERVCRTREEVGVAAATVWEEAQKALNAALWTERQGLFRHRLTRYERLLDPETLDVTERGENWTQEGLYHGSPFGSISAEELAQSGYIVDAGNNEWVYHGPDARVLLSNTFAESHCFSMQQHRDRSSGLVGLAFEPTMDRDKPDVAGVLWINTETAELEFVEFRYTNPPWDLEYNDAGGRIEFDRLDTGAWIVRRWWIRMPVIGLRPAQTVRIGNRPIDPYFLAAVRETGAAVSEVTTNAAHSQSGTGQAVRAYRPDDAGEVTSGSVLGQRRSGIRFGVNVSLLDTGSEVARLNAAPAFQGAVQVSTGPGLQLAGGVQLSSHGMQAARHRYNLVLAFVEPRFAAYSISSNVTPFLGARVGRAWEHVKDVGATFRASGFVYGGVGGATVKLDNRVLLELGLSLGSLRFGDYTALTDRRWEECVAEQGGMGVAMPATVATCSPPEFWTGPQLTPGVGTGISGTGDVPAITHSNTARDDAWKGFWVGVVFRL